MSNICQIDMMFLDDIFEMNSGYVLNFSDRTFAQFFAEELNIDINDSVYAQNGNSNGKHLRSFLQIIDKPTVLKTLKALWEYREALRQRTNQTDTVTNANGHLLELVNMLEGKAGNTSFADTAPITAFNRSKLAHLKAEIIIISQLAPQARGYAFEKFLKELFDVYELAAQDPFRLHGEQIDGSFQLANETYLLEAKWQNQVTGVADLHTFHGKIEQKAAWTRGLLVSNSGFTDVGLAAFGRGKRVICMDA